MDYRFLLGRAFKLQDQLYVASALGKGDSGEIVRATTRIHGQQVMRIFPAGMVVDHLLYDEEIELVPVSFA